MSVVDDIKNSFSSSDSSSSRSRQSHGTGSEKSFESLGGSDTQTGRNELSRSGDQRSPRKGSRTKRSERSPAPRSRISNAEDVSSQSNFEHSSSGRGRRRGRTGNDFPNEQAGRPREGSSQPQLSSQTERKMENAGLKSGDRGSSGLEPDNREPVSRQDLQELKSQNDEIIDLLKRINRNLEQLR